MGIMIQFMLIGLLSEINKIGNIDIVTTSHVGWANVFLFAHHYALTKLQGLRGVSFNWKDNAQNANTQIGLIAQEVEKVLPELVSTDSDGYKSIAYGKLTAVLVEAIKAQQLQIERLENRIPDEQSEINAVSINSFGGQPRCPPD